MMRQIIDKVFARLVQVRPETPFTVRFWDGSEINYGSGPGKFKIIIRSEDSIKKILTGGTLAFGEEYMAANIAVKGDLQAMLSLSESWKEVAGSLSLKARWDAFFDILPFSLQTIGAAKKNIHHHYDIGNDFYARWLDPTMTYSCAYFKNQNDSLETAQNNKYSHICRKLRLEAGQSLIDIGCGWGGMMFYAAKKFGVWCTGYTLSENQYRYVQKKIKAYGLKDSVKVYLEDYRKAKGTFDRFVSIGMFEHVGKKNYQEFFRSVKRLLKPKGTGLLHTIGTTLDRPTDPWVLKYIFPGGFIPTFPMIAAGINKAGLVFYDVEDLRIHYGMTLDAWIRNFEANTEDVRKIIANHLHDKDRIDQFMRMWRLYLNGSAASFKDGGNRLYQTIFSNGVDNGLPLTRDYIYRDQP